MNKLEFTDGEIWKIIDSQISRYRLQLMDELRNCPMDQVDRIRGQLDGIDWVAALPENLFTDGTAEPRRKAVTGR